MRRLLGSLTALVVFGCWGPHDNTLFSPDGSKSGLSGGGAGSIAGGGAGAKAGAEGGGGSKASPSASGTGSNAPGGGASSLGGGSGSGGASVDGAGAGAAGEGGGSHPTPIPMPSCDTIDGAVTNEANGHCYRVDSEALDFWQARDACQALGGHLVTISSEPENVFLHGLLEAEHWLGATDGRSDTTPGLGTYAWVNDEPWTYSIWRDGQPNALETACPTEGDESPCFEHCAYQTDQGDWVDRPCWHTIASICEWELDGVEPPPSR